MKNFFRPVLKLIYPPKCIFCGALVDNALFEACGSCQNTLPFKKGKQCKVCSAPLSRLYGEELCHRCRRTKRWFDKVVSPFLYTENIRSALIKFKFYGRRLYAKTFAEFVFLHIKDTLPCNSFDCVSYVPLHFLRYSTRGYNQSKLIAGYVAEKLGLPLVKSLRKVKNTKPLSLQKHKNRSDIIKDSYKIYNPSKACLNGKCVLMIDDIITTGASLSECSKTLKQCGVKKVYCACAAATPFE